MSSSSQRIRSIAKKEVVEFARDWRTILAVIIIPILIFPLLFIILPLLLESEAAELDSLQLNIIVQTDGMPDNLSSAIAASLIDITYEELPDVDTLANVSLEEDRLREREVDAVLRITQREDIWYYAILHFSTSERSNEARERLLFDLSDWEQNETIARIEADGGDAESTLDPLRWDGDISGANVATQGEKAGMALAAFIPLVLAVWTYSSAIQPSIDMTAGERERGTLEALLSLPCSRLELLIGKWVAVATITGVGVLLQIFGLLFAISYLASSNILGIPDLSVASLGLIALSILLFAVMVVAIELALAMRAHSVKEAGSVLGPGMMIIIFPALFIQVINLDGVESFWFGIPIVNVLLALRELFMNRVIPEHIIIWVVTSLFYAMLALRYAAKQFKREDIVTTLS